MSLSLYKLNKWAKMLLGKSALHVNQDEGKCYSVDEIKGYYNNLTDKVLLYGFPHGTIPRYPNEKGELNEFSIGVFQYGLACYDLYLMNEDKTMLEDAILCANWAVEKQLENGAWDTFGLVYKDYPYSSMAQGEAISLLARCYISTKDSNYLDSIVKAKDFLIKKVEEGGVMKIEGEKIYFCEYTFLPPILNGWIFTLWGLMDYCKLYPDDKNAKSILSQSIDTLKDSLEKYDMAYWSSYDIENKIIASSFYHKLHICQLNVMYDLTNIGQFKTTSDKWASYLNSGFCKTKSFVYKVYQKIVE